MSQKHWSFIDSIHYIEDNEVNPLLQARMKREIISEGECIIESTKLCKHLIVERTLDAAEGHQIIATYLKYSPQLLLKKKRAIRRLGVDKKYISATLRLHGIHYTEYGDDEHRVFLLNEDVNIYFSKHHQLPIYIVQRIELSNEEYRAFIIKVLPLKREV